MARTPLRPSGCAGFYAASTWARDQLGHLPKVLGGGEDELVARPASED